MRRQPVVDSNMADDKCDGIRPTTSLHWGDILTIAVYFVVVLLVGLWVCTCTDILVLVRVDTGMNGFLKELTQSLTSFPSISDKTTVILRCLKRCLFIKHILYCTFISQTKTRSHFLMTHNRQLRPPEGKKKAGLFHVNILLKGN